MIDNTEFENGDYTSWNTEDESSSSILPRNVKMIIQHETLTVTLCKFMSTFIPVTTVYRCSKGGQEIWEH